MNNLESAVEHAQKLGAEVKIGLRWLVTQRRSARWPLSIWMSLLLALPLAAIGAPLASNLWPECSVNYMGTAASVEFTGLGAGRACDGLIGMTGGYRGGPTRGAVVCKLQIEGFTATVRDGVPFSWNGQLLCAFLRKGVQP